MTTDCKPYTTAPQSETHQKMEQLSINESFLAYNYKSNFNYDSAKSAVSRIRLSMFPKEFVLFRTHEGVRIFRSL